MKWLASVVMLLAAMQSVAAPKTYDFESVTGLTPLNTDVQGTPLPATSSIVNEIPGVVISSLGPSKNAGDINGDGSDESFSGVSWLDFSGTGSTAKSGTRVITGANTDFSSEPTTSTVDFANFVEFRFIDEAIHTLKIWVELLAGEQVKVLFRDDLNGSNTLKEINASASGFVEYSSDEAFRNVVFIPVGSSMWLDDLTIDTDRTDGGGDDGGTVPEPGILALFTILAFAAAFARRRVRI